MITINKPTIRNVNLSQISGYHPAVAQTAAFLASQQFVSRLDVFSEEAIYGLFQLHPIHILKEAECCYVMAGFRSYQIALSRLDASSKITALVYQSVLENTAVELAHLDLYGSPLVHSLGTKSVSQLDRIKGCIGEDSSKMIAPGLSSTRSIQRYEQLK